MTAGGKSGEVSEGMYVQAAGGDVRRESKEFRSWTGRVDGSMYVENKLVSTQQSIPILLLVGGHKKLLLIPLGEYCCI